MHPTPSRPVSGHIQTSLQFYPSCACSVFLDVLANKQEQSLVFFKDGRIISGLYLCLGCAILNISIPVLTVISSIIAIVSQIIAVYIIYKSLIKKESTNIQKALILIGAFVTIFNPLSIEYFAYFESGIICLGKMLCVIAAKKLILDKKTIYPLVLVLIASICYQGILNVFITISILFIVMQKDESFKEKLKQIFSVGYICLITLFVIIVLIKGINNFLGENQGRIGNLDIHKNYVLQLFTLIVASLKFYGNLFIENLVSITLIVTAIILLIFVKLKDLLKYIEVVIVTILACTVPILIQSYPVISARTIASIGSLIGISIIFLTKSIENDNKKFKQVIVIIFSIFIFGLNAFGYIKNGMMINVSNKLEKEYLLQIVNEIKDYEAKEGKEIKNVAIYYNLKHNFTFCNFPNNTFTIKTLYTSYARVECIEYYLGHKLKEVSKNDKYTKYFKNNNYKDFKEEQLIFEGDTVHLCVF